MPRFRSDFPAQGMDRDFFLKKTLCSNNDTLMHMDTKMMERGMTV